MFQFMQLASYLQAGLTERTYGTLLHGCKVYWLHMAEEYTVLWHLCMKVGNLQMCKYSNLAT